MEMQPSNRQVQMGTLEFIFEGVVYFSITFYFGWVNKEWRYV